MAGIERNAGGADLVARFDKCCERGVCLLGVVAEGGLGVGPGMQLNGVDAEFSASG